MIAFYTTFFYEPLFNLLVAIYGSIAAHDLGFAIIILTILVRLALYPLAQQSIRAQKTLADLQPKLEALKEKHRGNREKIAEATMQLYKEEKVNPLSSCLPLLIQLPFFIALFQVFRNGTNPDSLSVLYSFVANPGALNPNGLFGLIDLSATRNFLLAGMAGAAQFWQGHMLVRRRPKPKVEGAQDEDFATLMNQQMTYVMPVVTAIFAWQFPAGLALYWFLTTLLLAVQQWYVFHRHTSHPVDDSSLPTTSSSTS